MENARHTGILVECPCLVEFAACKLKRLTFAVCRIGFRGVVSVCGLRDSWEVDGSWVVISVETKSQSSLIGENP